MKVLILGCGPAGLLAAHATAQGGHEPVILSRGARKSVLRGAQYLHSEIPATPSRGFSISHTLLGSVEGYRGKVYGHRSRVEVSPEHFHGLVPAWDIRAVYDHLWDVYGESVESWDASPRDLKEAIYRMKPALVISTVPAHLLCQAPSVHSFESEAVLISERARVIDPETDNRIVCSGLLWHRWYRQSRIQGWENTEYPWKALGQDLGGERVARVIKPIKTNCDCFPGVFRMGRYGRWEKGVLSDSAYQETSRLMKVVNDL